MVIDGDRDGSARVVVRAPVNGNSQVRRIDALVIWAALSDIRNLVIPNRVVGAILLLYPIHASVSFVYVDWPA